jgi:serine/threonine-protein kinase
MRDRRHVVPALIGLDKGEALNQISTFGWKTTVVEEANETVPIGIVVRTDPGAGAKLGESAEFRVIASAGPAPRALPELRGATFEAASLTLTQLGLQVTTADQVNDEDVPPGVVISWKVPAQPGLVAGATVVKGTTVAVVLSAGPKERTVPDLSGLTLADATAKLQVVKLVVAQGDDVFSAKIPIGAVAAQDPPAGQQVPRGATVTVSLSKGPDLVTVPPLADLTVQQVTDALAAAGLKLGKVKGDPAGLAVLAEVKGASIGADATEPRGTAIDVTFQVPPPPTTTVDPNATTTTAAPA